MSLHLTPELAAPVGDLRVYFLQSLRLYLLLQHKLQRKIGICAAGRTSAPPPCDVAQPPRASDANGAALCGHPTTATMPAAPPTASHRFDPHSLSALPSDASQRHMLALQYCVRQCCPDLSPYQRGAVHQKNALPTTTAPCRIPEVAARGRFAF